MVKKFLFVFVLASLALPAAFANELIVNGGFETGSLSPSYMARTQYCYSTCTDWSVSTANPHNGTFSATDVGNLELRQDFDATLGSTISNASFYIYSTSGLNAVSFFYSNGTEVEDILSPSIGQWAYEDVTSSIDPSLNLIGFSIWGTSPDFVSYVDDLSITATPITATPEPGTLILLSTGLAGLAGALRRKLMA